MSDTQTLDGLTLDEMLAGRRTLLQVKMGGTLTVRYADGTSFTYRSLAELDSALADLDRRITTLQAGATTPGRVQAFRVRYSSGYR